MMTSRFFISIALSLMLSAGAIAQSPETQQAPSEQEKLKAQKELEQKALAMLNQLIAEAPSFRLPENQLYIQSAAAHLLWDHDEPRARELFSAAMNTLSRLIQQPEDAAVIYPDNQRWQLHNLRNELLRMIASHDAQLAREFLRATHPLPGSSEVSPGADNETNLEMMLAQQIAAKDPKQALQIVEEKLATGKIPPGLSNVLSNLSNKDRDTAIKLVERVATILRAESQPLNYELSSLALYLVQLAPPPPARTQGEDDQPANNQPAKPLISDSMARELLEKVISSAQSELAAARQQNDSNQRNNANNLLNNLKSVMPLIERYASSKVAALERSFTEAGQILDSGQRAWNDLNKVAEKSSVEALLEAAPGATPEMRNNYYQQAAQLAQGQGHIERARQIISEHIADPGQRQNALQEIDRQSLWRAASEGKFDEARLLIARLRTIQERVNTLIQMAQSASNRSDQKLALQFLDEAWGLIAGHAETNQQFSAQLQLAGAYLQINPARSFEIIEATLDQFNELSAAAALLESFEQNGAFREKEMLLNNQSRGSANLYMYTNTLAQLARTDPDHLRAVLSRFARPEIHTRLCLAILQQLLPAQNNGISGGGGIISVSGHRRNSIY